MRELENAIKRALVLAQGDVLGPDDFAFLSAAPTAAPAAAGAGPSLEALVVRTVETLLAGPEPTRPVPRAARRAWRSRLLETVLARTGGNQLRAAALLGINRNTLRKKLTELGIEPQGREG